MHDDVHALDIDADSCRAPVELAAREGVDQDSSGPQTVLGVQAVARDADDAGDEAIEHVGGDEQPDPLPLAEAEDPHRDPEELLASDPDQRVARLGLADLGQRLGVVAVGGKAGTVEHVADLAPDHRDRERALAVRGRRVQAEEAALADDGAARA